MKEEKKPEPIPVLEGQLTIDDVLEEQNKCQCKNPGQDDGETTCWIHHDCNDGSCTHQE